MSSNVSIDLTKCCSKEKCSKLTWRQRAMLTIGFIMPVVTMILGITAYNTWHGNVVSFDDQISNWKMDPVLSIVMSETSTCPTGYALQVPKPFNYTTVQCDCSSKQSVPGCDSESSTYDYTPCSSSASTCGCKSVYTSQSLTVDKWPGIYPYLCVLRAINQNALARNRATDGSCAAFTETPKLCNYDDCVPASMDCLITNLTTVSNTLAASGGWIGTVDQNTTGDGYRMVYNRSVASLTGMDVTPEVEILIGQDVSYGARPDSRYKTFQQFSAYDVFKDNYRDHINTLTTQKQTGYLANAWMMTARREMPWQPKCPVTRPRLSTLNDKVALIDKAQLAAMLISIAIAIYNFIAAMHDYNEMTDDDPNNDGQIQKKKAVCNMVGEVINLVPTIAAMAIASSIYREFNDMKSFGGCSDDVTNGPLNNLAKKLNDLSTINVIKTIFSGLYLAYRIFTALRNKYCPPAPKGANNAHINKDTQMAVPPEYNPNQHV